MILFSAIDLYDGKAVRLYKGDYAQMTVYSDNPLAVALAFREEGATHLHLVDLEGARDGTTPNLSIVTAICEEAGLFTEIGGGIRSMHTVEAYLNAGLKRVILGTAAVCDEAFLNEALREFGERIAVGIDLKDGYVSIRGWQEQSAYTAEAFFEKMQALGVKTVICTDISKDGAMNGTNLSLYRTLSERFSMNITASGGVSSLADIRRLKEMGLYGAIIGKAYYIGALQLKEALEVAR